jgi:large subunit ribosomal protein L6
MMTLLKISHSKHKNNKFKDGKESIHIIACINQKESRIGKKPIPIPKNVSITIDGNVVKAKGPDGEKSLAINPLLSVRIDDGLISVSKKNNDRKSHQLHGLNRTLLNNMISGLAEGYSKELLLSGVGYRAKVDAQRIILSVGYSHDVVIELPNGIKAFIAQNVNLSVKGSDKCEVGNLAAKIRNINPPEPYCGKGIRYADEVVRLKEGKSGKK